MVDAPHLKQAQRILAQSDAADAIDGARSP
jgi:hypothetical protein